MVQLYKNQLQQYAQRERLGFPVYKTEVEGPPHLRQFKSTVIVDKKLYGTLEFFPTRKEAELAAAKVACEALLVDATQETTDEGLYKNLLQEFAIKRGLLPSYETVDSGMDHDRVFASTVEIGKQIFQGAQAKTKKQSQMNAAKVAYCSLTNGCLATKPSDVLCMDECRVADNLSLSIQLPATATTKKHHDISYEDPYSHAKRVKPSTESMDLNTPPPNNLPSIVTNVASSQVENSFYVPTPVPAHPIIERTAENEPMFPANTPPPGNIPPTVPISINSQVENSLSVLPPVDNSSHVSAPAPAHPVNEQTVENEPVLHLNTPPPSNFPSTVSNVVTSQLENSLPTPVNPVIEQTVKNEPVLHVNTPPPRVFPSTVSNVVTSQLENSLLENSLPTPVNPVTEQTVKNEPVLHVNTPPPRVFPSTVSNVVTSQLENSLPTPVDPVTEQTVGNVPLLDVKASSPSKLPSPSTVPILSNTQVEDSLSTPADPITEQTIKNEPLLQRPFKIVVLPQNSKLPIPEGATVMPFSDNQWIAYKIAENQAPMV